MPGLQKALLAALGMSGLQIPNAEGFGGGIDPPKVDPVAQIEYLATKRDAGEITEAEFEAQKRKLLGDSAPSSARLGGAAQIQVESRP